MSEIKPKNRKRLIVKATAGVVVAIVVLISFLLGYDWKRPVSETVEPVQQVAQQVEIEDEIADNEPQIVAASEWTTYNNDEFGYSISYPEDWETLKDNEGGIHIRYPGWREIPEGGGSVVISVREITLDQFIEEYNSLDVLEDGTALATIIGQEQYVNGDVNSYKLVGTTAIGLNQSFLFFEYGDQSYIVRYDDYDSIHLRIIETFTLISSGFELLTSRDNQLSFFYNEDWKCVEVVYDTRIDCYPDLREEEEYDAGLDQRIVYFPDITIWNDNCQLSADQEVEGEPVFIEKVDVGEFYGFYKEFNGCAVYISTHSYIDSNEKLSDIIR